MNETPGITNETLPNGGILIVDDTPANLRLLYGMLNEQGYKVRMAPSGNLALKSAQAFPPDLILLDIRMSNMNGYEVCKQLKADMRTRDIPVIFISSLDQTEDKVKAFTFGGVDYITKPFRAEEVLARVKTHLEMYSLQQQLSAANLQLQTSNDRLRAEIEKRAQVEAALEELATTDALTNLYNRRHFFKLAEQELTRAKRYQLHFSLLLIDLDNFKAVNDNLGHLYGDRVLQVVAKCISENSRDVDISGRYGGDEFVILLPETQPSFAKVFAERLCQVTRAQLAELEEMTISVTLSVGIANTSWDKNITFDTLLDRADQALYEAKRAGRDQVAIWREH